MSFPFCSMSIPVTPDVVGRLRRLQGEKKFVEERYYPGAASEQIRLECERRVNEFLEETTRTLEVGTDRDALFARARALGRAFDGEDTEEREKVDDYIGEAMRIIGIKDWTEHV